MDRNEFKRLAEIRLRDAKTLLKGRNYAGAYYLAGYAVECGLKACIAKQTRRFEFPDNRKTQAAYTHNLENLVDLAGLRPALQAERAVDSDFGPNWDIVSKWTEASRYELRDRIAAQVLYDAISDPAHGVLQWIRRHW